MSRLYKTLVWTILSVTVVAKAGRAADEVAIKKAIDRGLFYLKKTQRVNGAWEYVGRGGGQSSASDVGATAIAAVTLLKCGGNAADPPIQKAARYLRASCPELTFTYSISACIMFFDNLGDPQDVSRIEVLTTRLIGGQLPDGSWTYDCPLAGENEVRLLRNAMDRQAGIVPKDDKPPGQTDVPALRRPASGGQIEGGIGRGRGDHSNTQFACFALWIGRKRGLPVKAALKGVQDNFRVTQGDDGTWGYTNGRPTGSINPSMTCAGLIGLAVAYGYANELAIVANAKPSKEGAPVKKKPLQEGTRDPSVRPGLLALGSLMDVAMLPPARVQRQLGLDLGQGQPARQGNSLNQSQNYFLWSLERVAVAYGLETIGNKDWYGRGAELLLATQNQDGSWDNDLTGAAVETAFGLLFLQRANLAPDLSATLKGKIRDPGTRNLRTGGVIGDKPKDRNRKGATSKDASEARLNDPARPRLRMDDPDPRSDAQHKDADPEAVRLSTQLVEASAENQPALLSKLHDTEGNVYTQALALAIPQLAGKIRTAARDALADRLADMTAATLRDKLDDPDSEIRRAAALACALKNDKHFIPKLIELLEDRQTSVARAARAALQKLTKQNFGPEAREWRDWWNKQGEK
jgi:hypothetical protein